ncbi:MAG: rRNA maturation RNase YbeY [Candidatus Omnitrophica bacterium]|nr:rRNA maturation RNase YbeY [Candidatus Omnitrophota bacterium]
MKITIKNLQDKIPVHPQKIKNLIHKVLKGEKVKESGWINICFVNNSLIKKFNAKFLKTNSATDVLAFNLGRKKKIILADIMISTDTAIKQAGIFKTTPDYELLLYVTHGILHILGYNDRTKPEVRLMREKESEYVDR